MEKDASKNRVYQNVGFSFFFHDLSCTVSSQSQPSKNSIYRDHLIFGHHQYKPPSQVVGQDRLPEHTC